MNDTTTGLTNRAIAERAGYSVRYSEYEKCWYVFAGDEIYDRASAEPWTHIPDFLYSVDAALTLPLAEGYRFLLFGVAGDGWKCYIENEVGAVEERCSGRSEAAAEAVCAAWWRWMDEREE